MHPRSAPRLVPVALALALAGLAGCFGRVSEHSILATCPTCDPMGAQPDDAGPSGRGGGRGSTGFDDGDAMPPTPVTGPEPIALPDASLFGGSCQTTSDCGGGGFCLFSMADGCAAQGVCYFGALDCGSLVPYCACDGTVTTTKVCSTGEPDYASAPISLPATQPTLAPDGSFVCTGSGWDAGTGK